MLDEPALPPSKDESGQWALANLPAEHHAVVSAALECYRSEAVEPATLRRCHGHRLQEQQLLSIADWARVILRDHLYVNALGAPTGTTGVPMGDAGHGFSRLR